MNRNNCSVAAIKAAKEHLPCPSVSPASLRRAQRILNEGSPELIEQVSRGDISLYEGVNRLIDKEPGKAAHPFLEKRMENIIQSIRIGAEAAVIATHEPGFAAHPQCHEWLMALKKARTTLSRAINQQREVRDGE